MSTKLSTWIKKAASASRGSLTNYVLNAPREFGQPIPGPADITGLITPARMREVVARTPTPSACTNAILDYACNVPLLIRNIDPSRRAMIYKVNHVNSFLRSPNPQDTGKHFFQKLMRDMVTMGWAAIEIERDVNGKVANLWPLDGARVRIDYDEHGTISGYDMLDAHGRPIKGPDGLHAWLPEDVIYFSLNPTSASRYPTSRIAQLFSLALLEDMMIFFISQRFNDSNIPFGVFDIGDVTEQELLFAKDQWNSQAQSGHRIMLTGSKGGAHWYEFGYHLKDLEAKELLNQIKEKCMAILGVTKNELGDSEDVNKSNGYNLSYTFKKRAIEPVLNEITETLTKRLLWDEFVFDDLEIYYQEIDSRDELLQAQIDTENIKFGIETVNQIRNRRGDPSIPGGDTNFMVIGASAVPVNLLEPLALAQLQAIQMVDQGGGTNNPDGSSITGPQIRPPAMPIKTNTPDGVGGGAVRIRYPNTSPQKPRGPVQTLRNQGLRKEDM